MTSETHNEGGVADMPADIFDRKRRAALRSRAAMRRIANHKQDDFLWRYIADELQERLGIVSRDFRDVLIIGPIVRHAKQILAGRDVTVKHAALSSSEIVDEQSIVIEEDRIPFASERFDLIISAGTLDSVNDLPGALIQLRRCLKPDGLMLATLFGDGSLPKLKAAMMQADGDTARSHIHPQIDLRSAADLMSRTGFALPVADIDMLNVRYDDWRKLVGDLRDMGINNALAGTRGYLGKEFISRLDSSWEVFAEADGKVSESFAFLQLSGWAPSTDQPKAAKRGSGKVSLAAILESKSSRAD